MRNFHPPGRESVMSVWPNLPRKAKNPIQSNSHSLRDRFRWTEGWGVGSLTTLAHSREKGENEAKKNKPSRVFFIFFLGVFFSIPIDRNTTKNGGFISSYHLITIQNPNLSPPLVIIENQLEDESCFFLSCFGFL